MQSGAPYGRTITGAFNYNAAQILLVEPIGTRRQDNVNVRRLPRREAAAVRRQGPHRALLRRLQRVQLEHRHQHQLAFGRGVREGDDGDSAAHRQVRREVRLVARRSRRSERLPGWQPSSSASPFAGPAATLSLPARVSFGGHRGRPPPGSIDPSLLARARVGLHGSARHSSQFRTSIGPIPHPDRGHPQVFGVLIDSKFWIYGCSGLARPSFSGRDSGQSHDFVPGTPRAHRVESHHVRQPALWRNAYFRDGCHRVSWLDLVKALRGRLQSGPPTTGGVE